MPQGAAGRRYSFVTVSHLEDEPALALQARSLALYAPRGLIQEIIVVENGAGDAPAPWRERLLREYGPLADLVRFTRSASLVRPTDAPGWWTQQLLKLAVARIVTSDAYLLLDAKNLLAYPLARAFLEAPDGRPRMRMEPFHDHPLRVHLDSVMGYLGLDPAATLERFPTTAPPFIMSTSAVRRMMDDIARAEGRPFEAFFLGEQRYTEFFLYSGYLQRSGELEAIYALDGEGCPTVWADKSTKDWVARHIAEAKATQAPFFGVHRAAIRVFSPQALAQVADFWAERGLFPDTGSARRELQSQQRAMRWQSGYYWTVPRRALAKLGRIVGRR